MQLLVCFSLTCSIHTIQHCILLQNPRVHNATEHQVNFPHANAHRQANHTNAQRTRPYGRDNSPRNTEELTPQELDGIIPPDMQMG